MLLHVLKVVLLGLPKSILLNQLKAKLLKGGYLTLLKRKTPYLGPLKKGKAGWNSDGLLRGMTINWDFYIYTPQVWRNCRKTGDLLIIARIPRATPAQSE